MGFRNVTISSIIRIHRTTLSELSNCFSQRRRMTDPLYPVSSCIFHLSRAKYRNWWDIEDLSWVDFAKWWKNVQEVLDKAHKSCQPAKDPMHVTWALSHGEEEFPKDPNQTINILLKTILKTAIKNNKSRVTLKWQMPLMQYYNTTSV